QTGATGSPGWLLEADPAAATYTNTPYWAITSSEFTLTSGSTWTFTYRIRWRNRYNSSTACDQADHSATQTLAFQILPPGSSTWVTIPASNNSNQVTGGAPAGTLLNPFTTDLNYGTGNVTGAYLHDVAPNPQVQVQVVA